MGALVDRGSQYDPRANSEKERLAKLGAILPRSRTYSTGFAVELQNTHHDHKSRRPNKIQSQVRSPRSKSVLQSPTFLKRLVGKLGFPAAPLSNSAAFTPKEPLDPGLCQRDSLPLFLSKHASMIDLELEQNLGPRLGTRPDERRSRDDVGTTEAREIKEDWGKEKKHGSSENPNEKSDELGRVNDAPDLDGSKLTKEDVSSGSTSQDQVVLDLAGASVPSPSVVFPSSLRTNSDDLGPFSTSAEDDGLSDKDTPPPSPVDPQWMAPSWLTAMKSVSDSEPSFTTSASDDGVIRLCTLLHGDQEKSIYDHFCSPKMMSPDSWHAVDSLSPPSTSTTTCSTPTLPQTPLSTSAFPSSVSVVSFFPTGPIIRSRSTPPLRALPAIPKGAMPPMCTRSYSHPNPTLVPAALNPTPGILAVSPGLAPHFQIQTANAASSVELLDSPLETGIGTAANSDTASRPHSLVLEAVVSSEKADVSSGVTMTSSQDEGRSGAEKQRVSTEVDGYRPDLSGIRTLTPLRGNFSIPAATESGASENLKPSRARMSLAGLRKSMKGALMPKAPRTRTSTIMSHNSCSLPSLMANGGNTATAPLRSALATRLVSSSQTALDRESIIKSIEDEESRRLTELAFLH